MDCLDWKVTPWTAVRWRPARWGAVIPAPAGWTLASMPCDWPVERPRTGMGVRTGVG
ncbi:MAG: hypothetical protein QOE92_2219, partial [Chloroflexota bacterium]|nr:hypothetical protein [Chloroflexota bacterium]